MENLFASLKKRNGRVTVTGFYSLDFFFFNQLISFAHVYVYVDGNFFML